MGGIWTDMPFLRGQKGAERLVELRAIVQDGKNTAQSRRERVLSHEWARRELRSLMGYERAEQWTGYAPPARVAQGSIWIDETGRLAKDRVRESEELAPNDSLQRAGLIALLRKVEEYEREVVADGTDSDDQA